MQSYVWLGAMFAYDKESRYVSAIRKNEKLSVAICNQF